MEFYLYFLPGYSEGLSLSKVSGIIETSMPEQTKFPLEVVYALKCIWKIPKRNARYRNKRGRIFDKHHRKNFRLCFSCCDHQYQHIKDIQHRRCNTQLQEEEILSKKFSKMQKLQSQDQQEEGREFYIIKLE